MIPLQNSTFCLAISIIHLYFAQLRQTSVSTLCVPMPYYLHGCWEGYVGYAQEILSHYTYWLPLYRAPMQVNIFLEFQAFSNLTSRCD